MTIVPTALVIGGGCAGQLSGARGQKASTRRERGRGQADMQTGKGVGSARTRQVGRAHAAGRGMSPHLVFDDAVLLVGIYMQCQCGGETKAILS